VSVIVIARYRAQPDQADEVARQLGLYSPRVREEPGCLGFAAARSRTDPADFVLHEQYHDQDAFDAHVASTHYTEIARDRIRPLLAERAVEFYDPVEPG
jgi:(4S)-4-hydroxy-5-phosphonooxypentane-2,3-dione isomerase